MKTRRVVTAETRGDGVCTKVEDIAYDADIPGLMRLTDIWGYDGLPTLPVRPEEIAEGYAGKGRFPRPAVCEWRSSPSIQ